MRSVIASALAVIIGTALAAAPVVHASDERHGPGVGSVAPVAGETRPGSQASAGTLAQPKADSTANGVGIGALIGGATGLALMGWAYAQCDDTCDAPEPAPMYLMAGGVGAAVGGVVGLFIDRAKKSTNERVSVAGLVTPRRSQVRVTVRW
jgi:hypothetical protein